MTSPSSLCDGRAHEFSSPGDPGKGVASATTGSRRGLQRVGLKLLDFGVISVAWKERPASTVPPKPLILAVGEDGSRVSGHCSSARRLSNTTSARFWAPVRPAMGALRTRWPPGSEIGHPELTLAKSRAREAHHERYRAADAQHGQ